MNISDKTKKLLLLISIVTALLAVLVMFMGEGEKVTSLQRPEDASEKYELEAHVDGEIVDIEGDIGKRKYTPEEADAELNKLSENLETVMLGDNESLNEVREKLNLITTDKATGTRLEWSTDNYDICILSADSRKELEQHKNVVCEQLLRSYHNRRLGIGRPYARYRVERTLLEAGDALDMAQASDRRQQVYDPLSPQQLLLPIRGSREMQEFYDEFCREIAAKTTEEGMEDMLLTTRAYVQCNGDFKKTAKKLKQHENTIRYRINRLRNYLDVEEQPLLFHEIISLAVRIESMLEIKKNKEV